MITTTNDRASTLTEAEVPSSGSKGPGTLFALPEVDPAAAAELATALQLPRPLADVLWLRGHRTVSEASSFLHPSLNDLHDPASMLGMAAALDRLRRALLAAEPILIYGDYDVDGTVATVLLKTALERAARALGTEADVRFHIPHRLREGYGLRGARLAEAAEEGVRLVVSVDTGIRAFAAAEEARHLGLDLIVTDHHLPDVAAGVPEALAVLNPNQAGCAYPHKELCGAGVAFKLAQALLEMANPDPDARARWQAKTLPSFLKLLALATVADAVPLTGENRIIAAIGLQALRQPAQSGLRHLMELAGIDLARPLSAYDLSFRLGPRINAAGRMDIAADVVELFITRDEARARELALKLHNLNDERRATEAQALREIEQRLDDMTTSGLAFPGCLVLDDAGSEGWHRGVIGILASRVVERTGRPALVLAHEDQEAHGSGRSVPGFHLLDALTAAHSSAPDSPLFLRFGGHAHAAGFALRSATVPQLRERMETLAAALAEAAPDLTIHCDAELRLADLEPHFLAMYEAMAPFGHGNPEPLFLARGLDLCAPVRIFGERHVALQLRDAPGARWWRATAWGRRVPWAERAREQGWDSGDRFDIAFRLHRNWHPDFGGWELNVEALVRTARSRPAQSPIAPEQQF